MQNILIKSISIEYIKGIKKETFELNLIPNKPNFLVAPNGFDKSSLAIAFQSLNNKRLKLKKPNYYKDDDNNKPEIVLNTTENKNKKSYTANNKKNEIFKKFNVIVINNLIKPKANYRKINNKPVTSPSLEISDIIIIDNIPSKSNFNYKVKKIRDKIGDNRKIWWNISDILVNKKLMVDISKSVDLDKFSQVKISKKINDFIEKVKTLNGSYDEIINKIEGSLLSIITDENFNKIIKELNKHFKYKKSELYLAAIQIIYLYQNDNNSFKQVISFYNYSIEKKRIEEYLEFFQTPWQDLYPKEIPVYKNGKIVKKNLGIRFPKANYISNGERDVITFLGQLLKTELGLNSSNKHTILIIDEVFDYLDDANLIAVQFYINQFINSFNTKKIFPIILTHLNPHYFKNYYFADQKVTYLKQWKSHVNRDIENIVIARNISTNREFKDKISGYFLHYNPNVTSTFVDTISDEFKVLKFGKVNKDLCKPKIFIDEVFKSLDNYISGKRNFDPLSVCISLKLLIEKKVYDKLSSDELREVFIKEKKTVNKLNYAKSQGIIVDDLYYLLATLYNEILHVKKNFDNSSSIYLKLENKFIKDMVEKIKN